MRKQLSGMLDVLITFEEGKCYAHCLPFDLLAEGRNRAEAIKRLAEMVFEYIRFHLRNNLEPFLMRPAPKPYWDLLCAVRSRRSFVPKIPDGLLRVQSPNRIASYLNSVDAPACS
jgi:hypothetical protein